MFDMRESDREREAEEQQAAAELLQIAHDAAGLWRGCGRKDCLRSRICHGDAAACGARRFPEGWAWVHAALRALRDGAPLRAAMRGADREVIAMEKDCAFGPRTRKVVVHYPGVGESFEMTLLPEYMKGRRRPSAGARGRAMPRRS